MMKHMKETKHIPVLLQEAIDGLSLIQGDVVVDATLGGGGYTKEILKRILPGGRVIAIDTDSSALESFRRRAREDLFLSQALKKKNLVLVHGNYSALDTILEEQEVERIDALVADLGFSSDQIESDDRGLSFLLSGPLDMRLNREMGITAGEIVNTFPLETLEGILRNLGEEDEYKRIARAIIEGRVGKSFTTTDELRVLIENVYPKGKRYKMKIHPATKTFQALRIAVNEEERHLKELLTQAENRLKNGGRIAIVTFHSGEDRRVKQFWKEEASGCVCPPGFPLCQCGHIPKIHILTKKPILPTDEEIKRNPRARSAKLRIIEKK